MVRAGDSRRGFWRSVRELPDRTPLRVKLISAVLALVILALAVISLAGISYVRDYLISRTDSELPVLLNSADNGGNGYGFGAQGRTSTRVGERTLIEYISSSGQVYADTNGYPADADPSIPTSSSWLTAHALKPVTVSAQTGGDRWRVLVQPGQHITNTSTGQTFTGTVVAAIDVSDIYATVGRLAAFDLLVSVGIVLILTLLAAAAVRASLRPLTDIEQTAGAIAAGDLSRRVPERDPRTEVGRLGRSLNAMLSQIERAFHAQSQSEEAARRSEGRMRQFMGDASHELRTPLTAIRGFAEYYRQRGGVDVAGAGPGQLAPPDLDRIMRRVEQEATRMGVLVEDMLLLARLDQQRPLEARPVDLLTLAADAVHDARVVAPNRSINLTVGSGAALLVIGDEVRLRQVIGNLMSNALTHTPGGTAIDLLIRSGNLAEAPATVPPPPHWPDGEDEGADSEPTPGLAAGEPDAEDWNAPVPVSREPHPAAVLEVADHGPGLTKEQADHVFERFYRADQARTSGRGTGLGLAIVAALVAAHGGATWVRSQPDEGATFCIALPLSAEAVQGSVDDDDDDDEEDADAGDEMVSDDLAGWPDTGATAIDHAHGTVS